MSHKLPNIVLVVMDSARAQNLSCYGYHRETTPYIDRIAEGCTRYENAIASASWTLPSHASLFTGTYSRKHNAHSKHKYLDDRYITLQEILGKHGYETIGLSSNTYVTENFGLSRGFSDFRQVWQLFQGVDNAKLGSAWRSAEGLPARLSNAWKALGDSSLSRGPNLLKGGLNRLYEQHFFAKYDSGAGRINRIAKKWMSRRIGSEKPFYVFINYMEPHGTYDAPEPYKLMYLPDGVDKQKAHQVANMGHWEYVMGGYDLDGSEHEILEALYNGELTYTDYRVKELYDFLADRGILENTLLIITSDHGDELGEHNMLYHSLCLYDTILRVPLIIRHPEFFKRGAAAKEQVQLLDIFPTILDMLGFEGIEDIEGQSFLGGSQREIAVAEYFGFHHTVDLIKETFPGLNHDVLEKYDRRLKVLRTNQHKLIRVPNDTDELYDLNADPGEQNNIIHQEEGIAEELRDKLKTWESSFQSEEIESETAIDERTRKRLRNLGYIE